jgi:hypothetical protein
MMWLGRVPYTCLFLIVMTIMNWLAGTLSCRARGVGHWPPNCC